MTTPLKYVVTMEPDGVSIGPFGTKEEAQAYRDTDHDRDKMTVLEVVAPEPSWKKTALANWPNGVARRGLRGTASK